MCVFLFFAVPFYVILCLLNSGRKKRRQEKQKREHIELHFAFSVGFFVCPARFEFEHRAPQTAAYLAVPLVFSRAARWALPLAAHVARVPSINAQAFFANGFQRGASARISWACMAMSILRRPSFSRRSLIMIMKYNEYIYSHDSQ